VAPERRVARCGDATRAPTRVPKWLGRREPLLNSPAILAKSDKSRGFGGRSRNQGRIVVLLCAARSKSVW
jgi:hypothetical protein